MTTKKILTNPEKIFKKSLTLIESGQYELASKNLENARINFPKEFSFINLLAEISLRKKNLDEGINLLKKSLQINAKQPLVLVDLGIALSLNNKLDEALIFFDKSIKLDATNIKAYKRKAITLRQSNRLFESIECYQKIIDLSSNNIDAYINKAELLNFAGRLDDSLHFYQQAIKIDKENADLYLKCAALLNKLGRVGEAIRAYKKTIEIDPLNSGAFVNLGYVYQKQGNHNEASRCLRKSIEINEDYEVYINLAISYSEIKDYKNAIIFYDKAIKLDSKKAEAFIHKAYFYISIKEIDKAILLFSRALKANKKHKYLFGERFYAKNSICDWSNFEEDLMIIESGLKKNLHVAHPLAVCNNFDDPSLQKKAAQIWANDKYPHDNSLGPIKKYPKTKKIRIGYFSGDFSEHPVGFIVANLFERHDKNKFELFGFSLVKKIQSKTRSRIKNSCDEFFDVENYTDKEIALLARDKKIDIAIDLGGYTKHGRPAIFALRAAPIQISYLGYPGTTGVNYIDYNIADKFIIPKAAQQHFTEKIIYLPECYQPSEGKFAVSKKIFTRKSQGLPDSGFIFCCFNSSWKITPKIFKLWVGLLANISESVLWFPGFSSLAINNLRNECKKLGIDPKRLIFSAGEQYREDHYERIKLADIFLDCYPYGGHSTVSDFLRKGIPVVTLKGSSIPNMVASSILLNLGLSELITSSEAGYEKLAMRLANNPEYLKSIKIKLSLNIGTSCVYNINQYTKNIESGYIQAYDIHINSLKSNQIEVM